MPPRGSSTGGQNPEFILREFKGMNVIDARECIDEEEFYWCENAIPVGSGSLYPINGPALKATITGESFFPYPTYTTNFNVNGTDYAFAVFFSGDAWIVNLSTFATTQIATNLFSTGGVFATQYSNQGLLIIDPNKGYYDYNLTAPGILTSQNNSAANATLTGTALALAGGTSLKQIVTGAGTGATFQAAYRVVNVVLIGGGTGFAVGDTIYLSAGNPTTAATIVVAGVSGSTISAITLSAGGSYPGPTSSTLTPTGPTGTVYTTTGGGSGANFIVNMQALSMAILTSGSGYTGTTTVVDETSTPTIIDTWNITSSGIITGNSIATYAGRVWISAGRTVSYTDINSYSSFGGAGGSFTINDAYLHNIITALYAANNYLYIFGDDSIDALSNVTVTSGVTSFSRINITSSVGTSTPSSVFPYLRSLAFYFASGFYLLSGSTPEKISEKINSLVTAIVPAGLYNTSLVSACEVIVRGELCAAFQFDITDTFTQGGTIRQLIALFFRGRWWVASVTTVATPAAMFSIPVNGIATIYYWALNGIDAALYQAFNASSALSTWLLKSKFWDAGAPVKEKQSLNAAIGGVWTGANPTGVTINVDTELGTQSAVATPIPVEPAGYELAVTAANEGGSQYLGLTVTGSTGMTKVNMLALRGKADRDMLQ